MKLDFSLSNPPALEGVISLFIMFRLYSKTLFLFDKLALFEPDDTKFGGKYVQYYIIPIYSKTMANIKKSSSAKYIFIFILTTYKI